MNPPNMLTNFIILTKDVCLLKDRPLEYSLILADNSLDAKYRVKVVYEGETCIQTLPTDQEHIAREWYDRIVRGAVTPCTLEYVTEDME